MTDTQTLVEDAEPVTPVFINVIDKFKHHNGALLDQTSYTISVILPNIIFEAVHTILALEDVDSYLLFDPALNTAANNGLELKLILNFNRYREPCVLPGSEDKKVSYSLVGDYFGVSTPYARELKEEDQVEQSASLGNWQYLYDTYVKELQDMDVAIQDFMNKLRLAGMRTDAYPRLYDYMDTYKDGVTDLLLLYNKYLIAMTEFGAAVVDNSKRIDPVYSESYRPVRADTLMNARKLARELLERIEPQHIK